MELTIFFLALCITSVLSAEHTSLLDPEATDPFLALMEHNDVVGEHTTLADPPLLLTKYIEENKLTEAREAAVVDPTYFLPGVESYAGFLTVNKKYNANLWFWYFPVLEKSVEDTPWIIWLQGGPGASSLFGLFSEIGPFWISDNNTLQEMKYSWGKNHSLLFIDNPVGTGYSFTDDDGGYATNQTTIGENLYSALQQFLTIFPELRKAPLTIAGESYAGKHIPSLGVQILWHRHEDKPINLQGLAIGNGYIDPRSLQKYSYFVREIGLVDDNVADEINHLETAVVRLIDDGNMVDAYNYSTQVFKTLLSKSHLKPLNMYNFLKDENSSNGAFVNFVQRDDVRRALHVGNANFLSLSKVYKKLIPDMMTSAKMWLEELLDNYRVMLFNGHLDVVVAYHPSVNTYNALNFSGSSDYKSSIRKPWYHDGHLAGYYKVAANLTEVMVRGAGHMVPADKPAAALGLISAFARGISLGNDTAMLVNFEKDNASTSSSPQFSKSSLLHTYVIIVLFCLNLS